MLLNRAARMAILAVACQTEPIATCDAATQTDPEAAKVVEPLRFYAVWLVPGRPDLRGVCEARGIDGWRALEALLPNGAYRDSGSRLHRFTTRELALEAYAQEAERNHCPLPARVYRLP